MKLNIYGKNKEIVKTYETETYDLMFGTIEDIAEAVKIDSLEDVNNNAEIIRIIGNLMVSGRETVKELMKDIFPGLTDKELKNVKISEMIDVLTDVIVYTIFKLNDSFGGNEKN